MSNKSSGSIPQRGFVLPRPDAPFTGEIGLSVTDSTPDFPQPYPQPAGAPNILIIMTDDVGFGAASTFGGPIHTPTLQRVADMGLRYTRFHTAAMCSPTRAALITGRNPHNTNTGMIMERAVGFPGYNSIMPKSCGTIAEVLRQNGYNTAWFGKNHNVPTWEQSAVGPFDHWPNALGFEHFYGFINCDSNQWAPAVYENTSPREPYIGKPDYHFDADLADQAISWIKERKAIAPDKPFFLYYVPGATHAPHHVPKKWIKPFEGMFDQGWDAARKATHDRQIELGIIPEGTLLTERPHQIDEWDSLKPQQKKVFSRMMEIYAGFLHFADHNIGRVIDAIDELDQLDNTLIIYIMGDNGGSAEGTVQGTSNEMAVIANGESESLDYLTEHLDELGGPLHYNHYPVGWGWAMCSPMQWLKRYASHFGGTRNGMAMCWPRRITDTGGIRQQFHHVIDIAPTIFEAAGIDWPIVELNGVPQKPLDGISMAYTWDNAKDPGQRKTQYFEMYGNRGIYHQDSEGSWLACTTPLLIPWIQGTDTPYQPDDFAWELYRLDDDFSQGRDLLQPENQKLPGELYRRKLEQLKYLWWCEAAKNQVLPLITSSSAGVQSVNQRPSPTQGSTSFTFSQGVKRVPEGVAPNIKNKSWVLTADVVIPPGGAEGVIVTQGGRFGGWGLVVLDNAPVWVYRRNQGFEDGDVLRIEGPRLEVGRHTLVVRCRYEYPNTLKEVAELLKDGWSGLVGRGATFELYVDDVARGSQSIAKTVRALFGVDDTFDVGEDTGTPVLEDYAHRMPFAFTGKIKSVKIDLHEPELPQEVREQLHAALEQALTVAALGIE